MKRSEMYRHLQLMLVETTGWHGDDRESVLQMLRELIVQEDLAKFSEEQEADKA